MKLFLLLSCSCKNMLVLLFLVFCCVVPSIVCATVKNTERRAEHLLDDHIYSKVRRKEATISSKKLVEEVQSEIEGHVSNDLDDDKATRDFGRRKIRLPLLKKIFLYETQLPTKIEFPKGSVKLKATCFDQKDEDAVLRALELLNDIVPAKTSATIYDMYKMEIPEGT